MWGLRTHGVGLGSRVSMRAMWRRRLCVGLWVCVVLLPCVFRLNSLGIDRHRRRGCRNGWCTVTGVRWAWVRR